MQAHIHSWRDTSVYGVWRRTAPRWQCLARVFHIPWPSWVCSGPSWIPSTSILDCSALQDITSLFQGCLCYLSWQGASRTVRKSWRKPFRRLLTLRCFLGHGSLIALLSPQQQRQGVNGPSGKGWEKTEEKKKWCLENNNVRQAGWEVNMETWQDPCLGASACFFSPALVSPCDSNGVTACTGAAVWCDIHATLPWFHVVLVPAASERLPEKERC